MEKLLGLTFFFVSIAFASDFHRGENLISPFAPGHSNYDKYQAYTKSDSSIRSNLWVSEEAGKKDTFMVDIVIDRKSADLLKLQRTLNKPGLEQCRKFSSNDLNSGESNGYPQLTWETFCDLGADKVRILHKAIAGSDSLYLIRKSWYLEISQDVADDWEETMSELFVCDTREKNHPCPEGHELQEGVE
jgi:hypothetical protein